MNLRLLLILPVVLGFAFGENLLTNGDFEQELTVGWTQTYGGYGYHNVERSTWRHPDPDYEVWAQQYDGLGWNRLEQVVEVKDVDIDFSFIAKFDIGNGSSTCWPVAAVILAYYNSGGALLGDTRFCHASPYCNWTPSSTCNLIPVVGNQWMPWSLNVREEITYNLPGVDAEQVAKIGVALYDYTSGG
ncbi:MAG: hypothetical protein JSU73_13315 [candidate division WOR-3 bacterium]|nr:MAG: hypothetical protein JSU73_13315 [candidate division WOR-3 bacterium]